jgi:hypothetical protein
MKMLNGDRASSPGWTGETPVLHRFSLSLGLSTPPDEASLVLLCWELSIQIEIQFKHVDSRLSEET